MRPTSCPYAFSYKEEQKEGEKLRQAGEEGGNGRTPDTERRYTEGTLYKDKIEQDAYSERNPRRYGACPLSAKTPVTGHEGVG